MIDLVCLNRILLILRETSNYGNLELNIPERKARILTRIRRRTDIRKQLEEIQGNTRKN
jgi:uncharacterized protein YheU (UPF0270 family)